MEKISINSTSKNIFRAATKRVENNQTNPFGVSFKGKILTADVFENKQAKKINFTGISSIKSKMLSSAIVGSINDFASEISTRLNSIANFGRRIRQNASSIGNQISETWNRADAWWESIRQREVMDLVKSGMSRFKDEYSVSNLLKQPVANIEEMLTSHISMINA